MSRTVNLKRQHDAAEDLIDQIAVHCKGTSAAGAAYRALVLLAKLTGMLRIHFVQEDRTLYPYMTGSTNAVAATTARAFQAEMGGLEAAFDAFFQTLVLLGRHPQGFRRLPPRER